MNSVEDNMAFLYVASVYNRRFTVCIMCCTLIFIGVAARSDPEHFGVLLLGPGSRLEYDDGSIIALPAGARLRFRFAGQAENGSAELSLLPEDVVIPPIEVGSGSYVSWLLAHPGKGSISGSNGAASIQFQAALQQFGDSDPAVDLMFQSQGSGVAKDGSVVIVGSPTDPRPGDVRVVLQGRIVDVEDLLTRLGLQRRTAPKREVSSDDMGAHSSQ